MGRRSTSYQRGIVFRFVILIVLMLILTEFVDSKILHELGLKYGGFEIHFVKVLVTAFFSIPITSFWLKDYLKFREAEGRRHEEQKDFRSLFDYNPSMIILYSMEGKYLDANPAYLRYTGFTLEELRSAPPFISVDEAYRSQVQYHFQQAMKGNTERTVGQLKLYSGKEVILKIERFAESIDRVMRKTITVQSIDGVYNIYNTLVTIHSTVGSRSSMSYAVLFTWVTLLIASADASNTIAFRYTAAVTFSIPRTCKSFTIRYSLSRALHRSTAVRSL